jgi:hypothetical protein
MTNLHGAILEKQTEKLESLKNKQKNLNPVSSKVIMAI